MYHVNHPKDSFTIFESLTSVSPKAKNHDSATDTPKPLKELTIWLVYAWSLFVLNCLVAEPLLARIRMIHLNPNLLQFESYEQLLVSLGPSPACFHTFVSPPVLVLIIRAFCVGFHLSFQRPTYIL
jgi:hypothetical protein